jgi:hypothetical protein
MRIKLRNVSLLLVTAIGFSLLAASCSNKNNNATGENSNTEGLTTSLTTEQLKDKIKGGWAGQTIGVVYGAPVEFKYQGSIIDEYQVIPWDEHYVKYWWDKKPGLFDDIYTDLNFVNVFEKYGINANMDTIASYWANTAYHLAHANQASRYNILRGLKPPQTGHWLNNPHADDLDFQIESDFIGLMAPGMLNKATEIADRVGHIMNSGDGWYGGVYMASMYSMAFVTNDVNRIVSEALKTIPAGTQFHSCIADVVKWHSQYPGDWKATWFELEKKWNKDVGCPKGVYLSFNIDAKINSAYTTIGLLYGQGNYTKSVDIATRCGQDADCNAASVGGILGVMTGYSGLPDFWLKPLQEIEALNFEGTEMSLAKAYELSYKHALEVLESEGGQIKDNLIEIPYKDAVPVAFEQNFENTYPIARERIDFSITKDFTFTFKGNGYILYGNMVNRTKVDPDYIDRIAKKFGSETFGLAELNDPYVAEVEIYIDGVKDETVYLPMKNTSRRLEPAWKYQLKEGEHEVTLKWVNASENYEIRINDLVIYSENKPVSNLPI